MLIKSQLPRSAKTDNGELVLTFDAGDWFTGSLYDNLAVELKTSSIPQLQYFHEAKYDAIIFGNHEFDRHESALYTMLDKAEKLQLHLNFLVSNLSPLPISSKFRQFYNPMSYVKFLPYLIKKTDKTKIGVLGYVTPDALFVSGDNRKEMQFVGFTADGNMVYDDLIELATNQSSQLKLEHKCDIVVIIIHGGHREGEDIGLMNIPFVDLVLGGHSHESYLYSTSDSSMTSQCGSCGIYLTSLSVGVDIGGDLHFRGVPDDYKKFVDRSAPQCIRIANAFSASASFEKNIESWRKEIKDVLKVDSKKIVFNGNLSHIFQNSLQPRQNAQLFANMLLRQYIYWETANVRDSDFNEVSVVFWHVDFLEEHVFTQESSNVVFTYGDAYNLIHTSGSKKLHVFYIKKEEIYYTIQGIFILNKMVSPLMSIIPGGIKFDETFVLGIPIITNLQTIDGRPYSKWPNLIKVVANSILAPFFWRIDKLTYGFFPNFPKDNHGNTVNIEDTYVADSPTELELFLLHLQQIILAKT